MQWNIQIDHSKQKHVRLINGVIKIMHIKYLQFTLKQLQLSKIITHQNY